MHHGARQVFPVGNPSRLHGCSQMFVQGEARPRSRRPPHPRGAGRAGGTGAEPSGAGGGCCRESPEPGGTAGEEHGTAWSPRGPGPRAVAESGAGTGGSPGPSTRVTPARRLGQHRWGEHWILLQEPGAPRVGFSDSQVLQELYLRKLHPPSAQSSSKSWILLRELDPSRTGSSKNWIL